MLVMLCTGCGCFKSVKPTADSAEWMLSDSVVVNRLGREIFDIIFFPDSVNGYGVAYNDTLAGTNYQIFDRYIRITAPMRLDAVQTGVVQFLLPANADNYCDDTLKVQSPYIPVMEFAFSKKGSSPASIIISPSNFSWQIVQNGKVISSYTYNDAESINRLYELLKRKESHNE